MAEPEAPTTPAAPPEPAARRWLDVIEVGGDFFCGACAGLLSGEALTGKTLLSRDYVRVWCSAPGCAQRGVKMRFPVKRTSLPADE